MTDVEHRLVGAVTAFASVAPSSDTVQALPDAALLVAAGLIAAARREFDTASGWVAAEIARRSRRELGHTGLAQQQGYRTPESLLQNLTGTSRADATTLVRVGTMIADTTAADQLATADGVDPINLPLPLATDPNWWRAGIARAVTAGRLSYPQAEAIRAGLGEPTDAITGSILADAATVLLDAAAEIEAPLTVDELRRLARQMRDSIDADGLLQQEKAQSEAQYIRAWQRADGMVAGSLLLDRDNGAYFLSIIDELTAPRRGGPRFTDLADKTRAQQLIDDPRSTEQITADGIMQLLKIGVNADPGTIYNTRKPAVRIIVTQNTLTATDNIGTGSSTGSDNRGIIQDTGESISVRAIQRHLCESGAVTITVDPRGKPLDVGRDQRLFTKRQRIALATRDGGCMISGCDRPPSWTEAHHIDHWSEHHGLTNTEDGILLCRYHHLTLHNNQWRILRQDNRYFLRKTRPDDPDQTLTELHSKNPLAQLNAARQRSTKQRSAQHGSAQHDSARHDSAPQPAH